MKNILPLLLLSFTYAQAVVIEDYDCSDDKPCVINLKSENSIDGITLEGYLLATLVGDRKNTITGSAVLNFSRESDNKSFAIEAFQFGVLPNENCIRDVFDDNAITKCELADPMLIKLNKPLRFFDASTLDYISIDGSVLKVVSLWGFDEGMSEHHYYRIINTADHFEAKFLYAFPKTAQWNDDGSFSVSVAGCAVCRDNYTVAEVRPDMWQVTYLEYANLYRDSDSELSCSDEVIKKYDPDLEKLVIVTESTKCKPW